MENIDLTKLAADVRSLDEMEKVVYDKTWLDAWPDTERQNNNLYYMYRGIKENNGIRYDITVVPANMLGQEFIKTKGHYHIGNYGEIYTVLEGNAMYLMQKRKGKSEDEIEDVYAVQCKKGDVVVIPSGYGHITINPSENDELKMANWISSECKSDYLLYEKLQGACYYYIQSPSSPAGSSGSASWIKNAHYKSMPELRFEEPLKSVPENLDFLKAK